jgi:hypothetical protein
LRVTGQQHAQEFVLECFLRLRRLPSRATNDGGGGLRRKFDIAQKPLSVFSVPPPRGFGWCVQSKLISTRSSTTTTSFPCCGLLSDLHQQAQRPTGFLFFLLYR